MNRIERERIGALPKLSSKGLTVDSGQVWYCERWQESFRITKVRGPIGMRVAWGYSLRSAHSEEPVMLLNDNDAPMFFWWKRIL